MESMNKLIWQIKQFFRPFPDVDSWAYNFYGWLYDHKCKKVKTGSKVTKGFSLPTDFNEVTFRATATIKRENEPDLTISTKQYGVTLDQAHKNIAEFCRVLQNVLKERRIDEDVFSVLPDNPVDPYHLHRPLGLDVDGPIKENKSEKEKSAIYDWPDNRPIRSVPVYVGVDKGRDCSGFIPGQEDLSSPTLLGRVNRSPTLLTDRIIEYMLPPDTADYKDDGWSMYEVIDEVKKELSYDQYCALDSILVRTHHSTLAGTIDVRRQTFTPATKKEGDV